MRRLKKILPGWALIGISVITFIGTAPTSLQALAWAGKAILLGAFFAGVLGLASLTAYGITTLLKDPKKSLAKFGEAMIFLGFLILWAPPILAAAFIEALATGDWDLIREFIEGIKWSPTP